MIHRAFTTVAVLLAFAASASGLDHPGSRGEPSISVLLLHSVEGTAPERAEALRALGNITNETLVRAHKIDRFILRAAMNDDELPKVRKIAVESAVRLAANASGNVRMAVLESMSKLLEKSNVPLGVRWQVVRGLWPILDGTAIGVDQKVVDQMRRMASNSREPLLMRTEALKTLGLTAPDKSLDIFKTILLDQKNLDMQVAALEALGSRLTEKTFGRFINDRLRLQYMLALDNDKTPPHYRAAALIGLARIGVDAGIEKAVAVLSAAKPEQPGIRIQVRGALRALTIHRSVKTADVMAETYKKFVRPEDAPIRVLACTALGELYEPLAEDKTAEAALAVVNGTLILALRNDHSRMVVRTAAFWLGNIASSPNFPRQRAIEALIGALTDPDASVRKLCVESLEELTFMYFEPHPDRSLKDYQARWQAWYDQHKNLFVK